MKPPVLKFKEVRELKRRGKRWKGEYVEVIWQTKEGTLPPRIVITAFKSCGKAVKRNRIRRIIRNWVREHYEELPTGIHLLFRGYKGVPLNSWKEVKPIIEKELREWFLLVSKKR